MTLRGDLRMGQTVRLLDHDPDLARSLPPDRVEAARHGALVDVVHVPRGPWRDQALLGASTSSYGLLLLDGLVSRTVVLDDVASSQLLGRGDLIAPSAQADDALVPSEVRWSVLEPAVVALLDERFLLVVRRWPELAGALFERVAAQSARLGTHRALCHLPRV